MKIRKGKWSVKEEEDLVIVYSYNPFIITTNHPSFLEFQKNYPDRTLEAIQMKYNSIKKLDPSNYLSGLLNLKRSAGKLFYSLHSPESGFPVEIQYPNLTDDQKLETYKNGKPKIHPPVQYDKNINYLDEYLNKKEAKKAEKVSSSILKKPTTKRRKKTPENDLDAFNRNELAPYNNQTSPSEQKMRPGQDKFRIGAFLASCNKNSITGMMCEYLVACHILAYSICLVHNVYNSLVLTPNQHVLFDDHRFTIWYLTGEVIIEPGFEKEASDMGVDSTMKLRHPYDESKKFLLNHNLMALKQWKDKGIEFDPRHVVSNEDRKKFSL